MLLCILKDKRNTLEQMVQQCQTGLDQVRVDIKFIVVLTYKVLTVTYVSSSAHSSLTLILTFVPYKSFHFFVNASKLVLKLCKCLKGVI